MKHQKLTISRTNWPSSAKKCTKAHEKTHSNVPQFTCKHCSFTAQNSSANLPCLPPSQFRCMAIANEVFSVFKCPQKLNVTKLITANLEVTTWQHTVHRETTTSDSIFRFCFNRNRTKFAATRHVPWAQNTLKTCLRQELSCECIFWCI